jgi:hypothetical protein
VGNPIFSGNPCCTRKLSTRFVVTKSKLFTPRLTELLVLKLFHLESINHLGTPLAYGIPLRFQRCGNS